MVTYWNLGQDGSLDRFRPLYIHIESSSPDHESLQQQTTTTIPQLSYPTAPTSMESPSMMSASSVVSPDSSGLPPKPTVPSH